MIRRLFLGGLIIQNSVSLMNRKKNITFLSSDEKTMIHAIQLKDFVEVRIFNGVKFFF